MTDKNSKLSNFQVVGGQINYERLNSTVESRDYSIGKAYVWLDLINDGKRPTKWYKPTKKGTKISFDIIRKVDVREIAFKELEVYLNEVNEKYGIDITLDREKV